MSPLRVKIRAAVLARILPRLGEPCVGAGVPPFSPTQSRKNPSPNPSSRAMSMSTHFAAYSLPRAYSSRSLPSDGGCAGQNCIRRSSTGCTVRYRLSHQSAAWGGQQHASAPPPRCRHGPPGRDRQLALALACLVVSPRRRGGKGKGEKIGFHVRKA